MPERKYSFDALVNLKNAGALTASGNLQIGGVDSILDFGIARMEGVVVVGMTAIDTADANETYDIILEGSNSATFASGVNELASMKITSTGQFEIPFVTEKAVAGVITKYRYFRATLAVAGTTPSINFTAWVAPPA